MQRVLPTSLDMVSARVLGFDAQAYIDDTPSTLCTRLNICGSSMPADSFASKNQLKKSKRLRGLSTFLTLAISGVGFASLFFALRKGKVSIKKSFNSAAKGLSNIPSNLKKSFKNASINLAKTLDSVKKSCSNTSGKIKKDLNNLFRKKNI